MKRVLAVTAQFLLFLFVDAVGGIFYHPLGFETKLAGPAVAPRSFVWDGIIMMLLVYVLVLLIAVFRNKIRPTAPGATLAFVLAALAGYFIKIGFITHNW